MIQKTIIDVRDGEGSRPFSRGIAVDIGDKKLVVISGAASTDKTGATIHIGDVEGQTRHILRLIDGRLAEVGGSLSDIVKVLIFVRNIADYPVVNKVRLEVFKDSPPASSAVEARMVRDDFLVEIEAMAIVDQSH